MKYPSEDISTLRHLVVKLATLTVKKLMAVLMVRKTCLYTLSITICIILLAKTRKVIIRYKYW